MGNSDTKVTDCFVQPCASELYFRLGWFGGFILVNLDFGVAPGHCARVHLSLEEAAEVFCWLVRCLCTTDAILFFSRISLFWFSGE